MAEAIMVLSFGGPERHDEVIPFLENVLAGRNVPRQRMMDVAEHYYHFGGKSPINDQNRALVAALKELLEKEGPELPVYWGNRNWHPLVSGTMRQMIADGITRCYVFATSAFGSYSGCCRYSEDIAGALAAAGPGAPECIKLRLFYNHPGFIEPMADRVRAALAQFPEERRAQASVLYTAHSIPVSMSAVSPYVWQLEEACRIVSSLAGASSHQLVYQSRSGPASQPWLEPDIGEALHSIAARSGSRDVVVAPIGFISNHMEVLYDLDTEATELARELGLNMVRAGTVGSDARFVRMIRELVQERMGEEPERRSMGTLGAPPDECAPGCCIAARGGK